MDENLCSFVLICKFQLHTSTSRNYERRVKYVIRQCLQVTCFLDMNSCVFRASSKLSGLHLVSCQDSLWKAAIIALPWGETLELGTHFAFCFWPNGLQLLQAVPDSFPNLKIHTFIYKIFIECLLCAKHQLRYWEFSDEHKLPSLKKHIF